jgi:phytoene synthase
MKTHAKSFTLASFFFNKTDFSAATKIYHWCRYCDDAIDESTSDQAQKLQELRRLTKMIFDIKSDLSNPPFLAMREITNQYKIPSDYLYELLNGMEMDVIKNRYETIEELELYSFRVAGTVGLMMTHVMGLYHLRSLPVAVELGLAMQLTNIARDVKEDLERGRIYLPQSWLREAGIQGMDDFHVRTDKVFFVVRQLIHHSENYYDKAATGLIDLPFRAAWAVAVALELYREIGRDILRRGTAATQSRTIVSRPRKCFLVLRASLRILASLPTRMIRNASPVQLSETYLFKS